MAEDPLRALRDYLLGWKAAVERQDRIALLYVDAVRDGDERGKALCAELLRINSDHMDAIQALVAQLVGDPNFRRSSL